MSHLKVIARESNSEEKNQTSAQHREPSPISRNPSVSQCCTINMSLRTGNFFFHSNTLRQVYEDINKAIAKRSFFTTYHIIMINICPIFSH